MGGIPVAGTTAPMRFRRTSWLSLAETIALDYIFNALSDGKHRCFNLRMELAEHEKTLTCHSCTPEQCLCFQAVYEMAYVLFGIKPAGGAFRTNGKVVDAADIDGAGWAVFCSKPPSAPDGSVESDRFVMGRGIQPVYRPCWIKKFYVMVKAVRRNAGGVF